LQNRTGGFHGKFIAVPWLSEEFYAEHQHSIEVACTFLKVLSSNHPPLEIAFRRTLPVPLDEGAKHIETGSREARLTEARLLWLDAQKTAVFCALVPTVQSLNLLDYLEESRCTVLGAFQDNIPEHTQSR
jgi:hypothetical protein